MCAKTGIAAKRVRAEEKCRDDERCCFDEGQGGAVLDGDFDVGPPQRVARAMSVLRALARSARSASRCLSTSRPWTRSTWGEGAAASTWFAGGGHRGHVRNFASNPIEDSDIFGAGGAQGIDTCVKSSALTPSTPRAILILSVRPLSVAQVHEQGFRHRRGGAPRQRVLVSGVVVAVGGGETGGRNPGRAHRGARNRSSTRLTHRRVRG